MRALRLAAGLAFAGFVISASTSGQGQAASAATPQAAQASAQNAGSAAGGIVFQAHANLVLEDVVVSGRGEPVHGLDRSRFHVFEDGREQTITSFDEHQPGTAAAPSAALPANTYSNASPYPEANAINVLLLDGLNTPVADQMFVRSEMLRYLGKLAPGTTLAVFTLTSELRMVEGFTTDTAQLIQAVKDKKTGVQPSLPLNAVGSQGIGSLNALAFNAYRTDRQVRATLYAMQHLAGYLSAIPGRKNVIWFSASFPLALNPDAELTSPIQGSRDYARDYGEQVRAVNKLLTAARVAVYPVYMRGMMGTGYHAEQDSMTQIADQTGGHAYFNTNGFKEAMENAIENGCSYYTIGYIPSDEKLDGTYRKIKVKVDSGGYGLAYRHGYYADPPDKASAPGANTGVGAAILDGAPQSTGILFQSRVLAATDAAFQGAKLDQGPAGEMAAAFKGPSQRFIVDTLVDPRGLAFDAAPDGMHHTYAEFMLVAFDGDGNRVNYVERGLQMKLTQESYKRMMASGIPERLALDLPAGKFTLRIVVYDPAASRTGSLVVPVTVDAM